MSHIKNISFILLMSSVFLVFVPACQNMLVPPAQSPQEQKPIDVSRFSDIPVPAGFKLEMAVVSNDDDENILTSVAVGF